MRILPDAEQLKAFVGYDDDGYAFSASQVSHDLFILVYVSVRLKMYPPEIHQNGKLRFLGIRFLGILRYKIQIGPILPI